MSLRDITANELLTPNWTVGRGPKAIPVRRKNRNTFSQLLTKEKTQMAKTKILIVLPMS